MPRYIVNKNAQPNGDHEVHINNGTCPTMPDLSNRFPLGEHSNCQSAVTKAKTIYPTADGCANCCPTCHTR